MVSPGAYLLSAVLLAATVVSIGFSAFRLRRQLLPGWQGAPARLVEVVVAVALLIWLCELLGLFGLLYASTLVIESVLLAVGIAAWTGSAISAGGGGGGGIGTGESANPPSDRSRGHSAMSLVAIVVVAAVFAHWGLYLKDAVDHGISNFDSLSSFMPLAARIAQSHSTVGLNYTVPTFNNLAWLYPQNAELPHAAGILLTGRDTLSLFVNFGWLALALLAAWCAGRPYGRGPQATVAAAIVLDCGNLIVREPGAAKDDVMAAALLLAAVAILINARAAQRRESHAEGGGSLAPGWALAAAGLAAGLAAGTKPTVLAMAAALSVAAIALAPRGRRLAAAGWWLAPAVAGGGYWFLRNLVVAGNPLPQVANLGPVSLPHPTQLQPEFPAFSILHYATDTAVWSRYFGPGLELALGSLWPLVVGGAIAGGVLALLRGRDRVLRWLGGIALLGAVAYLATPLSAAGIEGDPFNFLINVRYAVPPLLVGLVLLTLASGLETAPQRWALLAALVAVFVLTDGPDAVLHDPRGGFGLLVALVAVGIPAAIALGRRWGASGYEVAAGLALLAMLLVVIGYPIQRSYLRDRYAAGSDIPGYDFEPVYEWAREISDARIGLAGTTAGFVQYGLYGTDLSNRVIYLGEKGPHGAFNSIPDCTGFRSAADAAHLDYLITSPFLNFLYPGEPISSPEAGWLRGSTAVEPIDSNGPVTVWRVRGSIDPTACGPENAPLRSVPQQPGA